MQLKEFSLFVPTVESGTVLKALETAIPSSAIEQALGEIKATFLAWLVTEIRRCSDTRA